MGDLTLWVSAGACSLAPRVLLNESGLPFEAIEKSIASGEIVRPEFIEHLVKRSLVARTLAAEGL